MHAQAWYSIRRNKRTGLPFPGLGLLPFRTIPTASRGPMPLTRSTGGTARSTILRRWTTAILSQPSVRVSTSFAAFARSSTSTIHSLTMQIRRRPRWTSGTALRSITRARSSVTWASTTRSRRITACSRVRCGVTSASLPRCGIRDTSVRSGARRGHVRARATRTAAQRSYPTR